MPRKNQQLWCIQAIFQEFEFLCHPPVYSYDLPMPQFTIGPGKCLDTKHFSKDLQPTKSPFLFRFLFIPLLSRGEGSSNFRDRGPESGREDILTSPLTKSEQRIASGTNVHWVSCYFFYACTFVLNIESFQCKQGQVDGLQC